MNYKDEMETIFREMEDGKYDQLGYSDAVNKIDLLFKLQLVYELRSLTNVLFDIKRKIR